MLATDISPDACALARENAEALGVGGRVDRRLEGDLFAPVPADARFDVVVSNPPYIAAGEIPGLSAEVRREPHAGARRRRRTGSTLIRRVVEGRRRCLCLAASLQWRSAKTQGAAVRELLPSRRDIADARVEKDLERRDRLAFGTQPVATGPQE